MKTVIVASILALSSVSVHAQSKSHPTEIFHPHQHQLVRLGSVSATDGTIDGLTRNLAKKAQEEGADHFKIVYMNTNNIGYAYAILYNKK